MTREEMYAALMAGQVVLGIELGSTRIKSVLLAQASGEVIATGGFDWENQLEDGIWTYHLDQVQLGVQESLGNWPTRCSSTIESSCGGWRPLESVA